MTHQLSLPHLLTSYVRHLIMSAKKFKYKFVSYLNFSPNTSSVFDNLSDNEVKQWEVKLEVNPAYMGVVNRTTLNWKSIKLNWTWSFDFFFDWFSNRT